MKINMIVAIDNYNGIGKDNKIPWNNPDDLKHFAKLTKGDGQNAVFMGRKTFESIGRPLPRRVNIVLTSQKSYQADGAICVNTYADAIKECENRAIETLWIIGGSSLYNYYLKEKINELYITEIKGTYDCDTFFDGKYCCLFEGCEILKTTDTAIYKKYFNN
jgi:dihydrofolate reductase